MPLRPIFSALLRNRVSLILIGLQIALTLALVCNALFIISERFKMMDRPSGMNETDTFVVFINGFGSGFNISATIDEDLAILRSLPGVNAAAPVISVPLDGGGWTEDIYLDREQEKPTSDDVAVYFTDDHGIDAYGVALIAGRNFMPEEVGRRDGNDDASKWPPGVIVTQALANRLFPGESALGKQFSLDKTAPSTVVGVVAQLQASDAHHTNVSGDPDLVEYSILVPQILHQANNAGYLIRAQPGRRDELMKSVETRLSESNSSRTVEGMKSIERLRQEVYGEDRAMMIILGLVVVSLLIVTGLGIVGLTNFWVAQRTRQIGMRRAMGATRADILIYFMAENFMVTTLGLVIGCLFSCALNLLLMKNLGGHLMPWYFLPIGFVTLWILGLLAVLAPALHASRIAPAMAAGTS